MAEDEVKNEGEGTKKDEKEASNQGLILPPADSGLYSTADHKLKETKTASGYLGGANDAYITHGPRDIRYCPKLRNVISTFVCRYHCLDGLPVDDAQILCGEAIWRQNVMDFRMSRSEISWGVVTMIPRAPCMTWATVRGSSPVPGGESMNR